MGSRRSQVESLLQKGRYLDALQSYVREPVRPGAEHDQFLVLLQSCLDHVFATSPAPLLPRLLQILHPRFGADENVMLLLEKRCIDEEMYGEAEYLLQRILEGINAECLIATEGRRAIYEVIVPRWHFPMLNDITRNAAYSRAISNAVGCIPDCSVLDIGSGTGLLSMLAVRSGAARVYACEVNSAMVKTSHDVISANEMEDRIRVVHKMSTDSSVPEDIPERVCLVVTETVDAGLLGEAIVPTLRHAWSQLLLPKEPNESTNQIARCGHVIPCGATIHLMAIECPDIAKQSRLLSEVVGGLSFCGIRLEGSSKGLSHLSESCSGVLEEAGENRLGSGRNGRREGERRGGGGEGRRGGGGGEGRRGGGGGEGRREGREGEGRGGEERRWKRGVLEGLAREPYTCERLNSISGGYRQLSGACPALTIDFTNPLIPLPTANLRVPVLSPGNLDAIATYFDLHLDETTTISTSPHCNENSWEQALYPIATGGEGERESLVVERGDYVHLRVWCTDTLVHVTLEKIERKSPDADDCAISGSSGQFVDTGVKVEYPISGSSVHFVDRGAICRLNDEAYYATYSSAISHALNLLHSEESDTSSIESHSHVVGMELDHKSNGMESGNETSTDVAECIVLDMTHELSILGIMAAKIGADFVQVGRCHSFYEPLLEEVVGGNGLREKISIKWVELTSEPSLVWDVVLCDVVSPQGILRPNVFEELGMIREYHTHSDTVILPGKVTVHCVGISSPFLRAQTMVLGSVPTLGLDIARFINKYQISHYIDVDLGSLVHDRLTEETELASIDLSKLSTKPLKLESKVSVEVTTGGCLTGFAYWFTLHFPNGGGTIRTGPATSQPGEMEGHWHQAVFCLSEDLSLTHSQSITLRALISDSLIDISLADVH